MQRLLRASALTAALALVSLSAANSASVLFPSPTQPFALCTATCAAPEGDEDAPPPPPPVFQYFATRKGCCAGNSICPPGYTRLDSTWGRTSC